MALVTATKAPTTAASTTTAEDTLKRKTRDANVVSGGYLVAKALKSEGVDTIFTPCGGHIIDIYDGYIDEGIRIVDVRHEQVAAHAVDWEFAVPEGHQVNARVPSGARAFFIAG
jgi:acetolactate synthase I/II/III large subunit